MDDWTTVIKKTKKTSLINKQAIIKLLTQHKQEIYHFYFHFIAMFEESVEEVAVTDQDML